MTDVVDRKPAGSWSVYGTISATMERARAHCASSHFWVCLSSPCYMSSVSRTMHYAERTPFNWSASASATWVSWHMAFSRCRRFNRPSAAWSMTKLLATTCWRYIGSNLSSSRSSWVSGPCAWFSLRGSCARSSPGPSTKTSVPIYRWSGDTSHIRFVNEYCCCRDSLKLISAGVHLAPEIRLFLRVWKSTPSSSRRQWGRRRRFYFKRRFNPDHNCDIGSLRSVLQAGKTKISHSYDGENSQLLIVAGSNWRLL